MKRLDLIIRNKSVRQRKAVSNARNWIGIEKDKNYCEVANKRIKEELKQKPLTL